MFKKTPNIILSLCLLLFILATGLRHLYGDQTIILLLFYMSEAGLVGGIADWFAVTALFRKPLGMPIKHTAIIPRNRQKLIEGVVLMVKTELLTEKMIGEQISRIQLSKLLIDRLTPEIKSGRAYQVMWHELAKLLSNMNRSAVANELNEILLDKLKTVSLTPYLSTLAKLLKDRGYFDKGFDLLICDLFVRLASPNFKKVIRQVLENQKDQWINQGTALNQLWNEMKFWAGQKVNAVNLDEATELIHREVKNILLDMQNPRNEIRVYILEMMNDLVINLREYPELHQQIEAWKNAALDQVNLTSLIEDLLAKMTEILQDGESIQLKNQIETALTKFWFVLIENDKAVARIDYISCTFLTNVLKKEYSMIESIVRSTLESFTDERLIDFIESKVNKDLNRIRINGSVLGATIGGLFFLILHFVVDRLV